MNLLIIIHADYYVDVAKSLTELNNYFSKILNLMKRYTLRGETISLSGKMGIIFVERKKSFSGVIMTTDLMK